MSSYYEDDLTENLSESSEIFDNSDILENSDKLDDKLYCKNINKPLKKILSIDSDSEDYTSNIDWTPPKNYGLNNSEQILNPFYLKNKKMLDKEDYIKTIKDNIRNMLLINNETIQYIKNLSKEQIFEILLEFNKSYNLLVDLMKGT